MKINDRSYGGKLFRPTPEIHINDEQGLFILASPWGTSEAAKDFVQIVDSQFRASMEDLDKTVVLNELDFLSPEENRLRMAIVSAHEDIREKYNEDHLLVGLEVLCCIKTDSKLSWFAVGAPFIGLRRENQLLPIRHPVDLSFDFSKEKALPPLPKTLLGLQSHINIESGNFRLQKNDELLLISRSYVPNDLFKMSPKDLNIESATLLMAKESENQPFWIGMLGL